LDFNEAERDESIAVSLDDDDVDGFVLSSLDKPSADMVL
jgi:hypothetical protein